MPVAPDIDDDAETQVLSRTSLGPGPPARIRLRALV